MPEKPKPFKPYPAVQRRPRERRESACKRGYDRDWQKLREAFLHHCPICVICLGLQRVVPAEEVDHVVPIHGTSDPLRLEWSNLQALCKSCHSRKTATENR